MRDSFSSQPPDLMARLSGTTSSLAWGEKCNANHEATTKVLYCPFFLLWLHNKTCNSHNTDQEVLVSPHLWIKTTYERTVPCADRLRPRSSWVGCENWVHFSRVWITILWVEYFMGVNISHHFFFSSLSLLQHHAPQTRAELADAVKPMTVQMPTFIQNKTELCQMRESSQNVVQSWIWTWITSLFTFFYYFFQCMNEHGQRMCSSKKQFGFSCCCGEQSQKSTILHRLTSSASCGCEWKGLHLSFNFKSRNIRYGVIHYTHKTSSLLYTFTYVT